MKIYGLTDEEVSQNRLKYGSNEIIKTKSNPFIKLLLESLGDPMIKILLIVLAIKFVFLFAQNDWFETLGIIIAIFLASFISSISEYGSNKAFESLLTKNNTYQVKVKRNNLIKLIPINEIVKDDIVYLKNGDIVPADGIIIDGEVYVDESCINGESVETLKKQYINEINEKNKLYKGTIITNNECIIKITSVGNNTLYGKIALELQETSADSPLKIRLRHLAKIISRIGYIGAFLVFFSYLFSEIIIKNNFDINKIILLINNLPVFIEILIHGLTLAITIIIVSVPEGLPMMVALVLSTNMKKMIKQNVLVRKMVGIETAGSLNYLLTDKTGTITNGKMSVIGIINCEGKIYTNEVELSTNNYYYNLIGNSIILNNDCSISENQLISGNSTDKALFSFMKYISSETVVTKKTFSSSTKYSSITTENATYFKGASEIIISKCTSYLDSNNKVVLLKNKELINNQMIKYMNKGYRILTLAMNLKNSDLNNLTYLGFVILKDDIRKEAKAGIELIKKAGINIIMITGDSIDTALYIAKEVNLYNQNDICLTSGEFNNYQDEEIKKMLPNIKIIARAKPNDKSRLVKIIEDTGLVVGMTGDGINDAPALKKASVGFAMGSGTEVAKEASDIIILDDNIKSIGLSILYGRTIFKNIRKFIIFQLTMNICAMSLSIIGPFIGISTPVTSMQMLWINMIMDTLAGLAFSYEEPELKYMNENPKVKNEPIINKYMYNEIIFTGSYSALLCLLFLKLPFFHTLIRTENHNKYFMTAFFALFVFMGIFNAFNTRTDKFNLFYHLKNNLMFIIVFFLVSIIQIIFIYFGGNTFRTYGLKISELLKVIIIAISVIPIDFIRKYYFIKHHLNEGI
jgi:Ca2+-transporting ATPase